MKRLLTVIVFALGTMAWGSDHFDVFEYRCGGEETASYKALYQDLENDEITDERWILYAFCSTDRLTRSKYDNITALSLSQDEDSISQWNEIQNCGAQHGDHDQAWAKCFQEFLRNNLAIYRTHLPPEIVHGK